MRTDWLIDSYQILIIIELELIWFSFALQLFRLFRLIRFLTLFKLFFLRTIYECKYTPLIKFSSATNRRMWYKHLFMVVKKCIWIIRFFESLSSWVQTCLVCLSLFVTNKLIDSYGIQIIVILSSIAILLEKGGKNGMK